MVARVDFGLKGLSPLKERSSLVFDYSLTAANPSFKIMMHAVKNASFGHYKYESTTVYFSYNGAVVGSAFVPSWHAGGQSTWVIQEKVELSSAGLMDRVHMDGKVELLKSVCNRQSYSIAQDSAGENFAGFSSLRPFDRKSWQELEPAIRGILFLKNLVYMHRGI